MGSATSPRRARARWVVLAFLAAAAAAGALGFVAGASEGGPRRARRAFRGAGDSLDALAAAAEALRDRILEVDPVLLGAALVVSLANGAFVARAWRRVIRAAYPDARLTWRAAFAVHYAGVGANAVLPARAGDALKLWLMHRRLPGSSYPTLAATLLVEALFGALLGIGLTVWAWRSGYLPAAPQLPALPLFELAVYAERPWILALVAGVVALVLVVAGRRVRAFWRRVGQGLVVLTQPGVYLRSVLPFQVLGFACRVLSAHLFLRAFSLGASVENALLVQVASGAASLVPATPGGLGPRQAMLVVLLGGAGTRGEVLAFGLGMEVALTLMHAIVGVVCVWALAGRRGLRTALRRGRAPEPGSAQADQAAGSPAPGPAARGGGAAAD